MRAQYPPLPAAAQSKPVAKRPSAIVNKDAVVSGAGSPSCHVGEAAVQTQLKPGFPKICRYFQRAGDAVRIALQAAWRSSLADPQMRHLAEMDHKPSLYVTEVAKQAPVVDEEWFSNRSRNCSVLRSARRLWLVISPQVEAK